MNGSEEASPCAQGRMVHAPSHAGGTPRQARARRGGWARRSRIDEIERASPCAQGRMDERVAQLVTHAGKPVRAGADGQAATTRPARARQARARRGGWSSHIVIKCMAMASPCAQGRMVRPGARRSDLAGKPVRAGADGIRPFIPVTSAFGKPVRAGADGWTVRRQRVAAAAAAARSTATAWPARGSWTPSWPSARTTTARTRQTRCRCSSASSAGNAETAVFTPTSPRYWGTPRC